VIPRCVKNDDGGGDDVDDDGIVSKMFQIMLVRLSLDHPALFPCRVQRVLACQCRSQTLSYLMVYKLET